MARATGLMSSGGAVARALNPKTPARDQKLQVPIHYCTRCQSERREAQKPDCESHVCTIGTRHPTSISQFAAAFTACNVAPECRCICHASVGHGLHKAAYSAAVLVQTAESICGSKPGAAAVRDRIRFAKRQRGLIRLPCTHLLQRCTRGSPHAAAPVTTTCVTQPARPPHQQLSRAKDPCQHHKHHLASIVCPDRCQQSGARRCARPRSVGEQLGCVHRVPGGKAYDLWSRGALTRRPAQSRLN